MTRASKGRARIHLGGGASANSSPASDGSDA
jgi:hypothetical protein